MKHFSIHSVWFILLVFFSLVFYLTGWKIGIEAGIDKALSERDILVIPMRQERVDLGKGKVVFLPNQADWDSLMKRLRR